MSDKPVRIRRSDGAEYVVKSAKDVFRLYKDAEILQYADKSEYDGKQPSEADDDTKDDEPKAESKARRRH